MNINKPLQTGQSWAVVTFGFLALSLAFSARAALGLVMPVWQAEFGWSSSYISSVGAATLVVMAVVAPIAGRLVDSHGPRFVLNFGLGLVGIGCGLVAIMDGKILFTVGFAGFAAIGFGFVANHVVATAVAKSVEARSGLATGIATSGSTGGQFLVVPMIAALLAINSWRWSFAALSLASFLLVPCIMALLHNSARRTQQASQNSTGVSRLGADLKCVVGRPAFHALFWSFALCGFTTTGVIETHLLPFASFCGFPPLPSATAYGLLSAVNLVGMVGAGWLTDRINRPVLLAMIYLLRGLSFWYLASLPGSSIETLFLFAVFFGAVDYSTVPVTASLVASHVGLRVMGLAMGLISAGHAIGGAAGAFLGGYLFDYAGDYDLLWLGSLWLALVAGLIVLFLRENPSRLAPA